MKLVDAEHPTRLDQIRQNYIDYLEEAAGVFEGAILCLKDDSVAGTILSKAKSAAHNIKGNAFMYGYPDLGRKAETVEQILLAALPANDLDVDNFPKDDKGPTLFALLNLLENIEDICAGIATSQQSDVIPTLIVPDEPQGSQHLEDAVSAPRLPRRSRKRIVLAYRDAWVSGLLGSFLDTEYDVIKCFSEEEILSALRESRPDLLVLDHDLPKDGSFTFLENPQLDGVNVFLAFNDDEFEKIADAISYGAVGFSENKLDILGVAQNVRDILDQPAKRVFIVDDDLAVREILQYHLESAGLQVDVAMDGIEALEYLEKETPDLIILDRFMPRLEGGTVLYEIQNKVNLKSIPVLVLTAMVNRGEAKTWFERGAADFIPKPFDPEEVCMRVKQHLESRRRLS